MLLRDIVMVVAVVVIVTTTTTAATRVVIACCGKSLMCDGVCIRALGGATSGDEVTREKGPRDRRDHGSADLHLPTSGHVKNDSPIKHHFFGYYQPFRGGRTSQATRSAPGSRHGCSAARTVTSGHRNWT
jgi:hypothetical protein